ncbi:MAG TPA: T9SS type A sorting domain-containing protein [Adhaeribacter sp.]|nr:T9SS type A sorting domain-containing protein [Adhaeribacter sp.]
MKTILTYCTLLFLLAGSLRVQGQTTITLGTGTSAANANALFSTSTTSNKYARTIAIYSAAEIIAAGGLPGLITKLAWYKDGTGEYTTADINLDIYLKHVSYTIHPTDPVTWATDVVGATQVYSSTTTSFPTGTGYKDFVFTTPFSWDGVSNLAVFVDFYRNSAPTASITWQYTTLIDGNTATQVGSSPLPTVRHSDRRPNMQLTFAPSAPTDAAMVGVTAPTSPVTPGVAPVTVEFRNFGTTSFTNATLGYSVNGTVIANNVPWTGTLASLATASHTFSPGHNFAPGNNEICAWIKVTGDNNAINDSTCTTVIACNAISGTFTIDKNAPVSATSFQSFADALQALNSCGVSGPVTFNVAANSGPYNEQVTLNNILGTSATNTITFNGNGNKIAFANSTANRAVIRLDGASHITFDNFLIDATDATYGWGVHFQNGADNNTISNNTITIASTSTTEANSVGVVFSGSTTTVTSSGNTGSNNVVSGNTITGGFKGIHLQSSGAATNNELVNNTIKDFYSMGIEVANANATLVEGNDISRPARTAVTTFYGIYLTTGSVNTTISKNRIHNTHGAATSLTGAVYPIYITASDAVAGAENVIKNNLIYNMNGNGTLYALYNSNSDGAHYYHNTVALENANSTGTVRGVYQTGAATNIKIVNNIFSIAAGASGVKTGLYFGTATSAITSNNNVLFVNGNTGYYSGIQATLADWKAANSGAYDQNSVSADPQFTSVATGNLMPTNAAINNIGQPAPAVTTDIAGLARNPNSPDPGAYEFMNSPNDVGISAITSPNSVCGLTAQEVVTVVITNFGTLPQSNIPVSYTINNGTPVTATYAGPLAPGASFTYSFATTADLSASGGYSIVASTSLTGDAVASNDAVTKLVANALIATLPAGLNFETPQQGVAAFKIETNSNSRVYEDAGAAFTGTKGMIMDGIAGGGWTMPVGVLDPWTSNPNHFSAAYACFSPAGGAATDSLWLIFDLKQLFKTANANTNLRITVNGQQEGPTYNPPFNPATDPIVWRTIKVDLTAYKNLQNIELGIESSVMEEYDNGNGPANLIDNVRIVRRVVTGLKSDVLASQLNVFPNPSAGTFTVSLPQHETFNLEVTDLTGKVIKTQQASGKTQLELNGTAKGIYLLKVSGKNGMAVKKLIVE